MDIIKEIAELSDNLCSKHLYKYPYIIEFTDRGVRYLGKFIKKRCNPMILRFSTKYLNALYKQGEMEQIKDTILHEIAHALTFIKYGKNQGHNYYWLQEARRIGCNGEIKAKINIRTYKYIYQCPHCKRLVYKLRKDGYACGVCCRQFNNGEFSNKYRLKLIKSYKNAVTKEY